MKIAIVVDSASGLSQKQAESRGWYYLPLYLTIDGVEYRDGIDIDNEKLFKILKPNSKVSTSATPIGKAIELVERLVNDYDKIVIYPISEGLSSQYTNLKIALKNYEKVDVILSNKVSVLTLLDILKFEKNIHEKKIGYEEALRLTKEPSDGNFLLVPKFNDALVRGGRLTPAAATVAKLLKIVPVIKLEDGKLQKEGKGRIFRKTLTKYFKDSIEKYPQKSVVVIHSNNKEIDEILLDFQTFTSNPIYTFFIPNIIAIHTGIEAVAFGTAIDNELIIKVQKLFN